MRELRGVCRIKLQVRDLFVGQNVAVEQPTKFEFVINLKTAKTLSVSIPDALLATANDVIE